MLKFREGDFIETKEGLIFEVKGLIHPADRIISFLRYLPSSNGERVRGNFRYKKIYDLKDRWTFLRKNFPQHIYFDKNFDREMQAIHRDSIYKFYDPKKRLNELLNGKFNNAVERDAVDLIHLFEDSGISISDIGITGSILLRLHTLTSDVDLIIYGQKASRNLFEKLNELLPTFNEIRGYDINGLRHLYDLRGLTLAMNFNEFCAHEKRKVMQGYFRDRDYFIRCVKDWNEINENYGEFQCRRLGRSKINAIISNDAEAIFTPSVYELESVRIISGPIFKPTKLISFRGRFCEQARIGERVEASGNLEFVNGRSKYAQLVVGESEKDFIISSDVIRNQKS